MSNYIYKLNGLEHTPTNAGDLSLSVSLDRSAGAYQYVTTLDSDLVFSDTAYTFIDQHSLCQRITFEIIEKCGRLENILYKGFFTKSKCFNDRDKKQFKVTPKEDSLYNCLVDSLDKEFNILETPQIVAAEYAALPQLEFITPRNNFGDTYPLYGQAISSLSSIVQDIYAREVKVTYCQAGEPQPPTGTGWELLESNCQNGFSTWVRRADALEAYSGAVVSTAYTPPALPPEPAPVAGVKWFLIDSIETGTAGIAYWLDYNALTLAYFPDGNTMLDNGRNLVDVINYGLNQFCPELDVQSLLLTADENPVTGVNPSSTKDIQVHGLSDIRKPTASLPATIQKTTLKTLLENWCGSSLNAFWRVDENTSRLIIEHYNQLPNFGTTTVSSDGQIDTIEYDETDIPSRESFDSTELDIDFGGVPIEYDNACSEGVKNYNRNEIYTDVETIINNPDDFSDDGLVFILADSLAPVDSDNGIGDRAENGAITGIFKPNAPLSMANLHEKFWKFYRPFNYGSVNLLEQDLGQMPITLGAETYYKACCLSKFNPNFSFDTHQATGGQLEEATINLQTKKITIKTRF